MLIGRLSRPLPSALTRSVEFRQLCLAVCLERGRLGHLALLDEPDLLGHSADKVLVGGGFKEGGDVKGGGGVKAGGGVTGGG